MFRAQHGQRVRRKAENPAQGARCVCGFNHALMTFMHAIEETRSPMYRLLNINKLCE